ncbi:MAG: hypothetical protein V1816_12945 [Pseudomonadota bacterium]
MRFPLRAAGLSCGNDPYIGKSFEHRKSWVQARLELLARTFALEIRAFAVTSNHLPVVPHTRPDLTDGWPARALRLNQTRRRRCRGCWTSSWTDTWTT